jgi:hypothetical protein
LPWLFFNFTVVIAVALYLLNTVGHGRQTPQEEKQKQHASKRSLAGRMATIGKRRNYAQQKP